MQDERREIVFLKLGGSLLTEKARPETPRPKVLRRLAEEIARALPGMQEALILGHGSGSFGHSAASRWDLSKGVHEATQLAGVAATQGLAARLHRLVVEALQEAGVAPFSIVPSSALIARSGRPSRLFYEPLLSALGLGLLPVLYGDVAMDQVQGVAIISTETLFQHVHRRLGQRRRRVRRALWAGETAGVLDRGGATIPEIRGTNLRQVLGTLSGAAGPDVTGGIRHRVEATWALARAGVPSLLFDGTEPGAVERALAGEEVAGTRVEG